MTSPGTGRFRSRHDTTAVKTAAVSIPGADDRVRAPRPLPPPTHLPIDHVLQPPPASRERPPSSLHDSASLVSGYGSMAASVAQPRRTLESREPGFGADGDEGYASLASTEASRNDRPLTGFGIHHSKFQLETPADMQMKKKLDKPRDFEKAPLWPLITSSVSDIGPAKVQQRQSSNLSMPKQLPIHTRHAVNESPARLVKAPTFPAISPWSSTSSHHLPRDRHLYSNLLENERSPLTLSRAARADETSAAPTSYGSPATDDTDMDDAPSIKRLHIDEAESFSGSRYKRAAASPPSEEILLHCVSGQGDVIRKRDLSSRASPPHRRPLIPHLAAAAAHTMSPASAVSRASSYISSAVSLAPTSLTPGSSFTRHSPCDTSTGNMSPYSCSSPRSTPTSTHSPRNSISGRSAFHVRNPSGASPRRAAGVGKANGAKIQGFYMCECCPKKPKKFETAVELHAHEAEKQYGCAFCRNRFKNKNEAERHQNSLHVRRHSWSCSALAGCERAFHDSTAHPGEADTCGFCGEEFVRSGISSGNHSFTGCAVAKHPTERDWEERVRHLQDVHKFGECNASKKFYRADHFRQHLKHSHAGTSGKWTNMLENACMVEEEISPR